MSIRAVSWAFDLPIKSSSQKLTLIALADCANDQGVCFPSLKHLEAKTSMHRQTLIKNLDVLESLGVVEDTGKKVGQTQQVKIYRLVFDNSPKNHTVKQSEISLEQSEISLETVRKTAPVPVIEPSLTEEVVVDVSPEMVYWNSNCGDLPKVMSLSPDRKKALAARRGDDFWKLNYKEAVRRMALSRFCAGGNDRGWKADFDFLLRPGTVAKVMEGKYDNRVPAGTSRQLENAI